MSNQNIFVLARLAKSLFHAQKVSQTCLHQQNVIILMRQLLQSCGSDSACSIFRASQQNAANEEKFIKNQTSTASRYGLYCFPHWVTPKHIGSLLAFGTLLSCQTTRAFASSSRKNSHQTQHKAALPEALPIEKPERRSTTVSDGSRPIYVCTDTLYLLDYKCRNGVSCGSVLFVEVLFV